MKYILLFLVILLIGCSSSKTIINDVDFSLKDEINESIIEGFYNGDTTGISKNIYMLK